MLSDKKIIEIQNEYYTMVTDLYGDLIKLYETTQSIDKAVSSFISQTPSLYVPNYSNNLLYRLRKTQEEAVRFWENNLDYCREYVISKKNVGFFGINDDNQVLEYKNEIRRNSLFYDILVFDDPFFFDFKTDILWNYNMSFLFSCVLHISELKKYMCSEDDCPFVMIFPLAALVSTEEKDNIHVKAEEKASEWLKDELGLTGDMREDIILLNSMSLEETITKLKESGISNSYASDLLFQGMSMSPELFDDYRIMSQDILGSSDADAVRAAVSYPLITALAIHLYNTYLLHYHLANTLEISPIISKEEWTPIIRDMKNIPITANNDYLYSCAVHISSKMSALMSIDDEEIIKLHNKQNCLDFRKLFYDATCEIKKPYSKVDEIADEVFKKTDMLLQNEYDAYISSSKQKRIKTVIGFIKTGLGFVPYLSDILNAFDVFKSGKEVILSFSDKNDRIEYFHKKRSKME